MKNIIISRCRKKIVKIQHPILKKSLIDLEIEGTLLNLIKGVYENHAAYTTFNGEKPKCFLLEVRNKTRIFSLITPIQYCNSSLAHQYVMKKQ